MRIPDYYLECFKEVSELSHENGKIEQTDALHFLFVWEFANFYALITYTVTLLYFPNKCLSLWKAGNPRKTLLTIWEEEGAEKISRPLENCEGLFCPVNVMEEITVPAFGEVFCFVFVWLIFLSVFYSAELLSPNSVSFFNRRSFWDCWSEMPQLALFTDTDNYECLIFRVLIIARLAWDHQRCLAAPREKSVSCREPRKYYPFILTAKFHLALRMF